MITYSNDKMIRVENIINEFDIYKKYDNLDEILINHKKFYTL